MERFRIMLEVRVLNAFGTRHRRLMPIPMGWLQFYPTMTIRALQNLCLSLPGMSFDLIRNQVQAYSDPEFGTYQITKAYLYDTEARKSV